MTIQEKRKKIRDIAEELGLCRTCLVREAIEGKKTCQGCADANYKNQTRRREKEGHCTRCGRKITKQEENGGYKSCSICRAYAKKAYNKKKNSN